jgi:hypothetical protein
MRLREVLDESGQRYDLALLVELLSVDPVRALDLAVAPRCPGLDVDVADAPVQHVVVEQGLELGTVEFLTGVKSGWMP